MSYYEVAQNTVLPRKDVRVSVFQHSGVAVSEFSPTLSLQGYDYAQYRYSEMYQLVKAVFAVNGTWIDEDNVQNYTVNNICGGLLASGSVKGIPFTLETRPLILPRVNTPVKGGITVKLTCNGKKTVRFGGGGLINMFYESAIDPNNKGVYRYGLTMPEGTNAQACGNGLLIKGENPFTVLVNANGTVDATTKTAVAESDDDTMLFCITFAALPEDIFTADAAAEEQKSIEYYENIFALWKVETPEQDINDAFEYARRNVEEGWFYPYGWVESYHHWVSEWKTEHTAMEEWAGNADRTRATLLVKMANLIDGAIVPEFAPGGQTHTHWGGDAPFTMREVEHYLRFTGDKRFAKEIMPQLETVFERALHDYDPVNGGMPGFGTQIGNQEDFDATPGYGGATASEFAHMSAVMGLVYELCENSERAQACYAQAKRIAALNYNRLFMQDVGRFAWYEDMHGNRREDPAYHALCYPVIYNQISDADKISGIDHMLRRLTGKDGEIYMSNHFGGHAPAGGGTWGMQAGANNQFVPSLALAQVGKNNDAVRPLRYVADCTCNIHRGCFPEVSREHFKSYFTPAACMYAQGIIESIFGLDRDMLHGITVLAPCLPDAWDKAGITLPGIKISYTQKAGVYTAAGTVDDDNKKLFVLRIAPCCVKNVTFNGKKAAATVVPHCGWFEITVDMGTAHSFDIRVETKAVETGLTTPACTCVGGTFTLQSRLNIVKVTDNCGILAESAVNGNRFTGKLKADLLDKYECYGDFGLINFSRRMICVTLEDNGVLFDMPVFITVLPDYYLHSTYAGGRLDISLLIGNAASGTLLLDKNIALTAPVVNGKLTYSLNAAQRTYITPGRNTAQLLLDGKCVTVAFDADEKAELKYVDISSDKLCSPDKWRAIGWGTVQESTIYCVTPDNILCDVFEKYTELTHGNLTFKLNKNGFLAATCNKNSLYSSSTAPGEYRTNANPYEDYSGEIRVDLSGHTARKVYLLLACHISNQHAFSKPYGIALNLKRTSEYFTPCVNLQLAFPGDIDIGLSGKGIFGLPSYVDDAHCKRGNAIPLPQPGDTDYPQAQPPEYPQHYLWNMRQAFEAGETVFSIVEIPLNRKRELEELIIKVNDDIAGIGLYAVTLA